MLMKFFGAARLLFNFFRKVKVYALCHCESWKFQIYGRVYITNYCNLYIGEGVTLNDGVYINSRSKIELGRGCRISAGAKLVTASLCDDGSHFSECISVGAGAWLGANSVVLAGVKLAPEVKVGAGAVVTKSVLVPKSVVIGVPARELFCEKK